MQFTDCSRLKMTIDGDHNYIIKPNVFENFYFSLDIIKKQTLLSSDLAYIKKTRANSTKKSNTSQKIRSVFIFYKFPKKQIKLG